MAQPTSSVVPLGSPLRPLVTRSNSITSTNSTNSSTLRRRSRTRTRTSTSTGRRGKSVGASDVSKRVSGELAVASQPEVPLPPLPTRSPRRARTGTSKPSAPLQQTREHHSTTRERTWSTVHVRDVAGGASRGRETKSEGGSVKAPKMRARGMSLPRSAFRTMSSSDESSEPSPRTPITFSIPASIRVVSAENQHFRDSMVSTGSSLYPQSTSTESYPESSIHPRSLEDKDEDNSSFSPRIVTQSSSAPDFDVDDVSYRLRLLVNNSYFLPPAHSKPTPLSLTPQNPTPPVPRVSRQVAPAFLDFFRMGKSKSKPSTPAIQSPAAEVPPGPVLRTTSDSTTASGYLPRPTTRSVPQTTSHSPFSAQSNPGNRVVVLRERMDDLMEAAKQAEREIKLRSDGRKTRSRTIPENGLVDDVIDPTDAVDLPPPSAGYPFAVQASALHGLGPQESLGAALLADFLPPSPGMWSSSSEDDSWRKAILHEAISLSLNESPETSFSTMSPKSPEPALRSPSFRDSFAGKPEEEVRPSTPKAMIGQRIVEPGRIELETDDRAALSPLQALQSLPSAMPSVHSGLSPAEPTETPWRSSASPPRRAETPAATMALTPPPPRKQLQSTSTSVTSPDSLPPDQMQQVDFPTMQRKTSNSSFLDAQDSSTGCTEISAFADGIQERTLMLSPPIGSGAGSMQPFSAQLNEPRASPYTEDDELSYATPGDGDMDDEPVPRPSMTLSLPSERPSLSEYSVSSPTASAFQDAVFGSCRTPSPLLLRRSQTGPLDSSHSPREISPHDIVLSPPPRTSSSLGPPTLPPPPRSPATRPVYRPSTSSGASGRSSHDSTPSYPISIHGQLDSEFSSDAMSPEPLSPPSLGQRREHSSSLSLRIPTEIISPPIHTAPAPASPTAFFDRIQSHPNAMDDLDTSDESDDDDDLSLPCADEETAEVFVEPRTQAISNRASSSSARPSIMRLGNHSTPQLTPTPSVEEPFPPHDTDPRKPIGNIPSQGTYFTSRSRKCGKGQASLPFPPFDPNSLSRESLVSGSASDSSPSKPRPSSSRRPHTAPGAEDKTESPRMLQREAIQRFDGMLMDHIAAERDTIKRITSNISHSQS